jgi:hypothetical protein
MTTKPSCVHRKHFAGRACHALCFPSCVCCAVGGDGLLHYSDRSTAPSPRAPLASHRLAMNELQELSAYFVQHADIRPDRSLLLDLGTEADQQYISSVVCVSLVPCSRSHQLLLPCLPRDACAKPRLSCVRTLGCIDVSAAEPPSVAQVSYCQTLGEVHAWTQRAPEEGSGRASLLVTFVDSADCSQAGTALSRLPTPVHARPVRASEPEHQLSGALLRAGVLPRTCALRAANVLGGRIFDCGNRLIRPSARNSQRPASFIVS